MGTQIKDTGEGYQIGTSASDQKLGFLGATPVIQQTLTVTGAVADDDNAATTGTAVNVVPGETGVLAYLESTTAGDADTTFEVGDGGPTVFVNDNDSPGGVQLYFDEDASNADERFLAVSPTNADLFLIASDGSLIRIKDDNDAATNGVAVYIDDDASNAYEKLMFVSPTDTAGSFTSDDTAGLKAVGVLSTFGLGA